MATYELTIDGVSGIGFNVSKKMKFGTKEHDVHIKYLKLSKKMYQPCEIQLILVVANNDGTPSSSDIQTALLKKIVSLKYGGKEIANTYFVHKIKPSYVTESGSSIAEVEMSVFSLDKLMTLDKFSKAHTAEKLGTDIFTPMLGYFKFDATNTLQGDINLQMLQLSSGTDEMRIPYAVQFNESFYDFLARIANRYGEFLYFEGGKIHLGLTATEDFLKDKLTQQEINWATKCKAHYSESAVDSWLTVDNQYGNYLLRENNDSQVFATFEEKDNDGNVTATHNFYNADLISSNEYLRSIKKGEYDTWKCEYQFYEKFIMEDLYKVLTSSSLARILASLLVGEAIRAAKIAVAIKNQNTISEKVNFQPFEGDSYKDLISGDNLTQFATYADSETLKTKIGSNVVNFNDAFYNWVREKEKNVGANAVYLEFEGDSCQPFKLGDLIKVGSNKYIITAVESERGESSTSEKQVITAIPEVSSGIYLPYALPQVVRESEPQRAYVTASIDPEIIGRVRIRYPWQFETDNASPWIRVALPFATNGGGVNFRAEVGDEVMVGYEFGNIDKPYVMGYLEAPYGKQKYINDSFPDRGMISKNGHQLTFNDPIDGGANFFWGWIPVMGTLKSFIPTAKWPEWLMSSDQGLVDLTGGTTITDRYGLYKISGSSDGRNVSIQSPMGDVNINAFTGISISAPNGDICISGKNVSIKAANNLTLSSGSNLKDKYIDTDENFLKEFGLQLLNEASAILEKALDLSFLRCVLEVFVRPIDGTLKIKSTTFVMVEAGPGKVEVPTGSYLRDPSFWKSDYASREQETAQINLWPKFKNTMELINTNVDSLINAYSTAYGNLCTEIASFNEWHQANDAEGHIISFDEVKSKSMADRTKTEITDADIHAEAPELANPPELGSLPEEPKEADFENNPEGYEAAHAEWVQNRDAFNEAVANRNAIIEQRTNLKTTAKQKASSLLVAIKGVYDVATQWRSDNVEMGNNTEQDVMMDVLNFLKNNADLNNAPIKLSGAAQSNFSNNLVAYDGWNIEKKILKRMLAYKLLTDTNIKKAFRVKNSTEPTDYTDDTEWSNFVKDIFTDSAVKEWFVDHYLKNFTDFADMFYRNSTWGPDVKGQILFSDNASKTIGFTRNGMEENNNVATLSKRYDTEIKRILGGL